VVAQDSELSAVSDNLLQYQPLAEQVEAFWSDPMHRFNRTWTDHQDINTVMIATSLSPEGYLPP
jgi:hypothetical protein